MVLSDIREILKLIHTVIMKEETAQTSPILLYRNESLTCCDHVDINCLTLKSQFPHSFHRNVVGSPRRQGRDVHSGVHSGVCGICIVGLLG